MGTSSALQNHFRDLSDAELQRRLASGDLTELAYEAAVAELRSRDVGALPPGDLVPAESSNRTSRTWPAKWLRGADDGRIGLWLGWLYFAALLASLTWGLVVYVTALGRFSSSLQFALFTATLLLDMLACLGYWGWLQAVRVGARRLWVFCVAAKMLQLLVAAGLIGHVQGWSGKYALIGMACELPLLRGLWRYASSQIWSTPTRESAPAADAR